MELRKYCVYNQTCECFLSLGVMLFERCFPEPTEIMGEQALHLAEGSWLVRSRDQHAFVVPAPCDLIYLDSGLRVAQVIESFPTLRMARWRHGAASVLALPRHTVYSSQTQPGHQLIISVASEMEYQLRSNMSNGSGVESVARPADVKTQELPCRATTETTEA